MAAAFAHSLSGVVARKWHASGIHFNGCRDTEFRGNPTILRYPLALSFLRISGPRHHLSASTRCNSGVRRAGSKLLRERWCEPPLGSSPRSSRVEFRQIFARDMPEVCAARTLYSISRKSDTLLGFARTLWLLPLRTLRRETLSESVSHRLREGARGGERKNRRAGGRQQPPVFAADSAIKMGRNFSTICTAVAGDLSNETNFARKLGV